MKNNLTLKTRLRVAGRRIGPLLAAWLVLSVPGRPVTAADRVALVIGNSKYQSEALLRNPDRDADAMEKALQGLGFTVAKKKDLDLRQMKDALLAFQQSLGKGSLALFYYAGHGLQVQGENYLVPVGADLRREFEVEHECLHVARVLGAMSEAEGSLKVVVLDCCRDNPFKRSWRVSRSASVKGLAGITRVPEGTMIAFSTSQDETSDDGEGANSPYTEHLVKVLESRPAGGLELVDVFRDASQTVKQRTGQVPWLNFEASIGKYYLWRPESGRASSTPMPREVTADLSAPRVRSADQTVTNSLGMKLTLIPAGEFAMGGGDSVEQTMQAFAAYEPKAEWFAPEHPRRRVRISKPFYLGTYEVTLGQFRQFVEASAYRTDAEKSAQPGAIGFDSEQGGMVFKAQYTWRSTGFPRTDEHPVVNVSWNDAVAFCEWLSRKEGRTYRLPTEAEWEYACRAGTTTRYYNGDDPETLSEVGNVSDATLRELFPQGTGTIRPSDGYAFTAPVGRFRANAFGLHDIHGNALEWCSDRFGEQYYGTFVTDDPSGPNSGTNRVLRGGSWNLGPSFARSANRGGAAPDFRYPDTSFRVVRP